MTSIRSTVVYIFCLVVFLHLTGCRSTTLAIVKSPAGTHRTTSLSTPENNILVFFFRNANFAGDGRTHLLKIDNKTIGPLTSDNYYRLEMWPGVYEFSISLPREQFFGQVSAPSNVSRQISLKHHPAGNSFICRYTDGLGTSGFLLEPIASFPANLNSRFLAKNTSAFDTAQVTQLFGVRYDGPAIRGLAHGQGTLSWPDGGIYKGTFVHGVPTRKARFRFPDGRIFMGPNLKGRPASTGVLMAADGRILFSGSFVKEQPDGVGLRNGDQGPEFCLYDNGNDITKTFRQLAAETLDFQDAQQINAFSKRIDVIKDQIDGLKDQLNDYASGPDPDMQIDTIARIQKDIKSLEKQKRQFMLNMVSQRTEFIEQLRQSRFLRELAKEKAIRKQHHAKIEKERNWCMDEFNQGRNLCTCAPFADDFHLWQECWEPLRKRYID